MFDDGETDKCAGVDVPTIVEVRSVDKSCDVGIEYNALNARRRLLS